MLAQAMSSTSAITAITTTRGCEYCRAEAREAAAATDHGDPLLAQVAGIVRAELRDRGVAQDVFVVGTQQRRQLGFGGRRYDARPQAADDPQPLAARFGERRSHPGISVGCIVIGANTSTDWPTSVPLKPAGATPTIVNGWALSRMRRADHVRLAAELPHPEAMAQDRDGAARSARARHGVVVVGDRRAEGRR